MRNLIGDEAAQWREILAEPDLCLHLYGKVEARPGPQNGPCHARLPRDAEPRLSCERASALTA